MGQHGDVISVPSSVPSPVAGAVCSAVGAPQAAQGWMAARPSRGSAQVCSAVPPVLLCFPQSPAPLLAPRMPPCCVTAGSCPMWAQGVGCDSALLPPGVQTQRNHFSWGVSASFGSGTEVQGLGWPLLLLGVPCCDIPM